MLYKKKKKKHHSSLLWRSWVNNDLLGLPLRNFSTTSHFEASYHLSKQSQRVRAWSHKMHQDRQGLTGRVVAQLEGTWGLWLVPSSVWASSAHKLNYVLGCFRSWEGKSLSPLLGTGEAVPRIGVSRYGPPFPVQEEVVETGKEGPWKPLKCCSSLRTESSKGLRVWLDLEPSEFWPLYNTPPERANSSPVLSSPGVT